MSHVNRRNFLRGTAAAATGLILAGCERLARSSRINAILDGAEDLDRRVRKIIARRGLAQEFPESAISAEFRANGSTNPGSDAYQQLLANAFTDYRLKIDGLVERPLSLSLDDLRQAPTRTQITRHDCVEGWSCIGKWRGAVLGPILEQAKIKPNARYIAFFCADSLEETLDGSGSYYETIDIDDAYHPQTLLAYEMNDRPLLVAHGAPLRLRLERQLGYKMAKYIMRIEAIEDFHKLGRGKGGYWEDRGYQWDAGI
jgi:DMSO/TMAO reductase YedYZ molybdopterin-dependent catalytic subunit